MSKSLKAAAVLLLCAGAAFAAEPQKPQRFGFGKPATPAQIAGWDIDVRASDGKGLPPGSGTVAAGEELYMTQCAACHGEFQEGAGRYPELLGGKGSLATEDPRKTIDSFWPYAPGVYDYIRRSMPFGAPQSLSTDEVYAILAYILNQGDLWPADKPMDAKGLAALKLPNRDGFILGGDPRPDVKPDTCMKNCRTEPARITSDLAARLGVTPTRTGD
jgi:mono/diheme cytochrome c family protein